MPRKQGLGRTGGKHKQDAKFDLHRRPKADGNGAASFAIENEENANENNENMGANGGPPQESDAEMVASMAACEVAAPEPVLRSECAPSALPSPPPPPPTPPTGRPAPAKSVLRLRGSRLAEDAVEAAQHCEMKQVWLRSGIDEPLGVKPGWEAFDADRRQRWRRIVVPEYLAALAAIKERFPMKVCCDKFESGNCTHGIPCECGGTQAPWPWIIHHPFDDPFCDCHIDLRSEWVSRERWYVVAEYRSRDELVAEILREEAGQFRPECEKEGYGGSGCSCNVCYVCSEPDESDGSDASL